MREPLHSLKPFYTYGEIAYGERVSFVPKDIELPGRLARIGGINLKRVSDNIRTLSEQNDPAQSGPYGFERRSIQTPDASGTVHFFSTSNAGGRQNPANLVDSGVYAEVARKQGLNFCYWALAGNSATSGMQRDERELYALTGSLLRHNKGKVAPMDYVKYWAELVGKEEGTTDLFAKGHGGIVATAIGVALEGRDVRSTLQVDRPGFVHAKDGLLVAQAKDEASAGANIDYVPVDGFGPHRSQDFLRRSLDPDFRRPLQHFVNNPAMAVAHLRAQKRGPETGGAITRDLHTLVTTHPDMFMRFIATSADVTSGARQGQLHQIEQILRAVSRTVPEGRKAAIAYDILPGSRKTLSLAPQVVAAIMADTIHTVDMLRSR